MSGMASHGKAHDTAEHFKRSIARRQLHAYLSVYNGFNGHFMGSMGNVSCGGFMLICPLPVMLDVEYSMQLHLPAAADEEEYILPFKAISRWCRPDLTPGHFDVGFSVTSNHQVFAGLSTALMRYFSFMHPVDA